MARRRLSELEEDILSKTGVTLPDGRVYRPGHGILSAADASRAANERARVAALDAQTVAGRASSEMLAKEQARLGQPKPNYFLNGSAAAGAPAPSAPSATAPIATFSPDEDFAATQLLRDAQTRGLLPDRDYSDKTLAKATPAQRIAESKLLEGRIKNRGLSIAALGSASGAPATPSVDMAPQAAEFIPGTTIKAPQGVAISTFANGDHMLVGKDGVTTRIAAGDTSSLAAWAQSQEPAVPAAPAAPSFSEQLAAVRSDASRAIAMGNDPRVVEAASAQRIAQLDPTGEKQAAIDLERKQRESALAFETERKQRDVLAKDAEARAEASFNRMLPDIQRAYEATAGDYASLEKTVNDQVSKSLANAGAPIIAQAQAAANALGAAGRSPAEQAAAQQILSAVESNNPEVVAGIVGSLSATYPLELGGAKDAAEAFSKEAASLRSLAARQLQQEGSQLRNELAKIRSDARYRVGPGAAPATNGRPPIASVGEAPAAPINPSVSADPLDIVAGGSPAPSAAPDLAQAESAPATNTTPPAAPTISDIANATGALRPSARMEEFAREQAALAAGQTKPFWDASSIGGVNRAALFDRLGAFGRAFGTRISLPQEDGSTRLIDLPQVTIERAMAFPEGSAERNALLMQAEADRISIERRLGKLPAVNVPDRPALSGFAV